MKTLLIANRGEIACRIIRSARALGLRTIAVYSEADAKALHVEMADEAAPVGPPQAAESYLDVAKILDAARKTGADAIHPGYGFLAENADFARAAMAAGLAWVGPAPETIEAMGDKERARERARAAGVPILPGSARLSGADAAAVEAAGAAVGFPLLVKASAGGGGIGMKRVDDPAQLAKVAEATSGMAARAFGDGAVYFERYVARARHVEVQVFGLGDGRAFHLFERDCSTQRRFQKIVEESPAPGLSPDILARMAENARDLAASERYAGAGTVEFIVDADSGEYFFLEMNTRIQVEHPVTEMICGVDLVAMQIRHAAGEDLEKELAALRRSGAAVECRLYAENPKKMFLPAPGALTVFETPNGMAGVRVDTGVRGGDAITPYYDPMVAKFIGYGPDRDAALDRLIAALEATRIEGLTTNRDFLIATLRDPAFRRGEVWTGYVDERRKDLVA